MASNDMIQLTLTLKMTTAKVVETSVTVNNNSPIQDYVHPHDQTQPTFEKTPGFKPFTIILLLLLEVVGYEVIIANLVLCTSLAIYHLISNTHSWNNCYLLTISVH